MDNADRLMMTLVLQYQQLAMMAMGKLARPGEGVRIDLDEAAYFIDVLAMLEEKTRGHLGDELARLLSTAVTDLRLNFVDERRRQSAGPAPAEDAGDGAAPAESAP